MKNWVKNIIAGGLWGSLALASVGTASAATDNTAGRERAFQLGEKIHYDIYFNLGFIWVKAAQGDMSASAATQADGREAVKFELAGKTVKAFKAFNIRDTLVSWADAETLFPYKFEQENHEDDYHSRTDITFGRDDEGRHTAQVHRKKKYHVKDSTLVFEKDYADVLSSLYKLRSTDASKVHVAVKYPLPVIFSDGLYDLYWKMMGREEVKLKNGETYKCIKIVPCVAEGKLFDKGEVMTIWLTDDDNHLPIMVESKLKIGSIKAMMYKVENAKYPLTSAVKKK